MHGLFVKTNDEITSHPGLGWCKGFLLALFLSAFGLNTYAHDPGLSTASARLGDNHLEVTFAIAIKDALRFAPLDTDHDGAVSNAEFETGKTNFVSALSREFLVEIDGQPKSASPKLAWIEKNSDMYCVLTFPGLPSSNLTVQSKLLDQLPVGHRQFFTLADPKGHSLAERLLHRDDKIVRVAINSASFAAPPIPARKSFASFLVLGVEHIVTGYDHLLFLFALLVVTSRVMPALKIITCFTVAHSITLAVATLTPVQFPSRIVEPLIAASIVYVGIENLFRGDDPKGRWLLTFAFGLVHGFGFASVLGDLGVGAAGSGIALPLISFNLGVELGQILVAAMALPIIWRLRTHPIFLRRCVPACSLLVAILGGYWLIQRVGLG